MQVEGNHSHTIPLGALIRLCGSASNSHSVNDGSHTLPQLRS